MASPPGARGRLSILIFHRVLPLPDPIFPMEMHARRFDELCAWLKTWFEVMPLDKAVSHLKTGSLPARAAAITFDDGYADNHDVAVPILRAHGLPATFFIATGFVDGGRMWNDTIIESIRSSRVSTLDLDDLGRFQIGTPAEKSAAIDAVLRKVKYLPVPRRDAVSGRIASAAKVHPPDNLMMTSKQLKVLRHAGMQIGAHTVSHPILASLGDDEARAEIKGSKDFLERLLEDRISLFAYPNGKLNDDYNGHTARLVRELGFDAATSTHWGAARSATDLFHIPRFTPWDHTRGRFGYRLLSNLWTS